MTAADRLRDWLTVTCPCDHDTPCDCKRRREAMVVALESMIQCVNEELKDLPDVRQRVQQAVRLVTQELER